MKTPEDIKTGLLHCSEDGCKGCNYKDDCDMTDGFSVLAFDALVYIFELEREHDALLRDLCNADQNNCEFCKHRRDAVTDEMCEASDYACGDCEHNGCPCRMCAGGSNWEWRGVTDRS